MPTAQNVQIGFACILLMMVPCEGNTHYLMEVFRDSTCNNITEKELKNLPPSDKTCEDFDWMGADGC